jgi:hypothetical protein
VLASARHRHQYFRTSDGDRLDYNGVIAIPALAQNMPTIITDEAVLTANGLPADAVHRGDAIYRGGRVAGGRVVQNVERSIRVPLSFAFTIRKSISMNTQSILWGGLFIY